MAPGTAPAWASRLLLALPYARRLELERRPAEARVASLAGLALALCGAVRVAGAAAVGDLRFAEGEKPKFHDGPCFSISHCGLHVCAGVAADTALGVDLETVPAGASMAEVARLRRWTATEATLKAAGLGVGHHAAVQFAHDLAEAELHGGRYLLRPWQPAPDATGYFAARAPLDLAIEACDPYGATCSAAVERALGVASQLHQ